MNLSTVAVRLVLVMIYGLLATGARAQTAPAWVSVQRSTSSGPASSSLPYDIAVAVDGSQYVTGTFEGTLTFGTVSVTAGAGLGHVFLVKYSAAGVALWAKQLDGFQRKLSPRLAVDAAGSVYLTSSFSDPLTIGMVTLNGVSPSDCFLVKYDAQGAQQWVRQGGGASDGVSVATDAAGNVAIAGASPQGGLNFGGTPLAGAGVFYVQFSSAGSLLQARRISNGGFASNVTTDGIGNTYISGGFGLTPTFGPVTLTNSGGMDLFVCKLDAAGSVQWVWRDGGPDDDVAGNVAVAGNGNLVVCGVADRSTTAAGTRISKVYVARLSAQGTMVWSRKTASVAAGPAHAAGVAYDGRGGYLVAGRFENTVAFGTTTLTAMGTQLFVARYDSQGNAVWAGQAVGASSVDFSSSSAIAADASGNGYLAGFIGGNVTFGTIAPVSGTTSGGFDTFVAKLTPGGIITASRPAVAAGFLTSYPNPASGQLTVVLPAGGGHLEFIDALGRIVRVQALPGLSGEFPASVAGLPAGLYQLRATLGNGQIASTRLVVK